MSIDTIIDYQCEPKAHLTNAGLLERLKNKERAEAVIRVYRQQGDFRPLHEMGFAYTRRASDGSSEEQTLIVEDVLNAARTLDDLADYCQNCPVNATQHPFGCITTLNFPITEAAEIWLLKQLPPANSPLLHILARGIEAYGYDGETLRELRTSQAGIYFQSQEALGRPYPDANLLITTDQILEMMFLVGKIERGHAAMLLLFLNAIQRDNLSPETLFWMVNGNRPEIPPTFALTWTEDESPSIRDLKRFLYALYRAYIQGVGILVDL
jgi:hypothetical protein